jgi:NADH-quinone oxidoreductase subunit H
MAIDISSQPVASYFSYFYAKLSTMVGGALLQPLSLLLALVAFAIIIGVVVGVFAYLFGWMERKVVARVQSRHGPTYVGKFGILQNLADIVKLLSKENIIPDNADKPLFLFILPLIFAIFVLILGFLPLTGSFVGINTSWGLLAVFIALSFTPLLLFLAGWTSGNKFSSISAQRSVMILVSYEIPLMLVVVSVAMLANGYGLGAIVAAQQSHWFVLAMPLGFVAFFMVMLAELERSPFDLREADNELIAGWLTDVGAPYFGLALFLDYTRVFVGTLLMALLFFGGWLGPAIVPGFVWLLLKVVALVLSIIIIRATMVRMKIDRVLKLGWLYLMPLAVVNLLISFILFVR